MDQVIVPAPAGSEGYVELSRTPTGKLFRKHILNLGELIHPKTGERLTLDEPWYDRLKHNFDAGVCDIVQVPLADAQNRHSEDPLRNLGEVVDVQRDGGKVYAVMDIRKPDEAEQLGKTLLGASAFLNLDYTDTRTGKKVGPALLHSCVTNRPYVTGLDDYEEVIAASADGTGDVVLLSAEEPGMPTREEMIAALKSEHGIDVEALQATASAKPDVTQLTSAITAALAKSGTLELSGKDGKDEVSLTDITGAITELAGQNVQLTGTVNDLRKKDAEREVDAIIGVGRLLPKARNKAIEMVLSGDQDGLEAIIAPENEPYVKLSHQDGAAPPQGEEQHVADIDAEVARLTSSDHTKQYFAGAGK